MKKGICFSGGGIKGAAHIGVIKALEEENIEFDCIAGTSAGSIIATLWACGYNSDEMYKLFQKYAKTIKHIDWKNILKILYGVIFKQKLIITGLNSGEVIEKIINKACNDKNIYNINDILKQLLIPTVDMDSGKVLIFNSCKIDLENREEEFISQAQIGRVVRASCSYPMVFSPCPYGKRKLLDGGIKENIPWNELKFMNCERILSIGFSSDKVSKKYDGLIGIAERSFELICEELNRHELQQVKFLHTIKLNNVSLLQIEKMQEIFEEGYAQTKRNINEIKMYLDDK